MYRILRKIKRTHFSDRFAISEYEVGLPNGKKTKFYLRESHLFSLIIPFLDNETVIMVEQFRFGAKKKSLEFPMGVISGEKPLKVATEELQQETGYKAKKIYFLKSFYISPGWSNQIGHIFVAKNLIAGKQEPEPYEFINVKKIKWSKVGALIKNGAIFDASTILSFFYFKNFFGKSAEKMR